MLRPYSVTIITFDMTNPPDPKAYNALVYDIVRQIPAGRVVTYGQVAALIAPPEGVNLRQYEAQGPRWVGAAMANCPDDIPWQRVINAQGKISHRPGAGPMVQRQRLEAEGVEFDDKDRVNLKKYTWEAVKPPEADSETPEQLSLL
jgi:methylated-DNA-protein-cysteine methyltransferase-like protein